MGVADTARLIDSGRDVRAVPARWIDLGHVAPSSFHATYAGLAAAQTDGAPPIVVWARVAPHISLGRHQDAGAELKCPLAVPVVRRPLGGGAAWIDESQHCYVLIMPLARLKGRPSEWFGWGLAPAVRTYAAFGLNVVRDGQDLSLSGRKLAGSGAATIGTCAVLGSSFLLRFPVERFAACIAAPSQAFTAWLVRALRDCLTDWESHLPAPSEEALRQAFRQALAETLGWTLAEDAVSPAEAHAIAQGCGEWEAGEQGPRARRVPYGIKVKRDVFLTERHVGDRFARVLTRSGRFEAVALSAGLPEAADVLLRACPPAFDALRRSLAGFVPREEAASWARLILETACFHSD